MCVLCIFPTIVKVTDLSYPALQWIRQTLRLEVQVLSYGTVLVRMHLGTVSKFLTL